MRIIGGAQFVALTHHHFFHDRLLNTGGGMLHGSTNNKHDTTSGIGLSHHKVAREKSRLNDENARKKASQPLTSVSGFKNCKEFNQSNHVSIIAQ
jgi:hypothetical protein